MTGNPETTTRTVDASAVPARPPRPRLRRRLTSGLAVAGALSVALGGALMLRDASVPIAAGDAVLGAPVFHVEYADAPSANLVAYEHGAAVGFSIELSNDGPLPITIEDVPIGPMQERKRLLNPTEVLMAPPGSTPTDLEGDLVPFEPFRLGVGETRTVVVSGVFYNCVYYTERAMDLIASQPVTWSVAGLSRTTEVALADGIAVRSTFIRECPGRVMDRGARTRTGG